MPTFQETLDSLRGRIARHRGKRAWRDIAQEAGVASGALASFLEGKSVTVRTIERLESWCTRQEEQWTHQ